MHITWLGQTCVKIQTKYIDEEVTLLIDPYKPETGEFPRSFSAQIVLLSSGKEEITTLSQEPFIIDTLGEFDIKNVMITTWPGHETSVIYKITVEGINIVHLGKLKTMPSDEVLESLGKVDILMVPCGGNKLYLEPQDAAHATTVIEPRIVIPVAYQSDSSPEAKPLTDFIKQIGLKPELTDKKIIIKTKDLPQEDTKLMVLEKNV
jgi:L-ascorbate metabolism protein UlaG (beta-lactamase superfamily)